MPVSKTKAQSSPIFQLKVTLLFIEPPIWRRILVPSDLVVPKIHKVLQTAMGWTNSHLHDFLLDGRVYSEPDEDNDFEFTDYRKLTLAKFHSQVGKTFQYNYDPGDGWEHEVLLEAILMPDPSRYYPVCIDGARRAPPEDCGGPGGYEENLKTIKNKKHPEYKQTMAWLPKGYNPEEFDLDQVNKKLQRRGFGVIVYR